MGLNRIQSIVLKKLVKVLASEQRKVMEQIIVCAIMWHMQDSQRIRPNKHGFMKGKSCSIDLISTFVKVISLKSCGCWAVVYLDFSKSFDTVSYSILEKLAAYGMDRCTLP